MGKQYALVAMHGHNPEGYTIPEIWVEKLGWFYSLEDLHEHFQRRLQEAKDEGFVESPKKLHEYPSSTYLGSIKLPSDLITTQTDVSETSFFYTELNV